MYPRLSKSKSKGVRFRGCRQANGRFASNRVEDRLRAQANLAARWLGVCLGVSRSVATMVDRRSPVDRRGRNGRRYYGKDTKAITKTSRIASLHARIKRKRRSYLVFNEARIRRTGRQGQKKKRKKEGSLTGKERGGTKVATGTKVPCMTL